LQLFLKKTEIWRYFDFIVKNKLYIIPILSIG
jgi:hypothetical protein